jgi:glycosyltransferase involved in cell wall biosynthesis
MASNGVAPAGDRKMRILMVLEADFTPRGGGGAESQLRTIALHLQRLGHEVTIVTPLLRWGPQVTAERCFGIPVGRIAYPRKPLIGTVVMCARFGALLWERRNRYDAWHVHIGHYLGAVTCLFGSVLKKPVVVKISGWWELEQGLMAPRRGPFDAVARRLLKRAGTVQAISTRIRAELERLGFPKDRILVLPNAVDTKRFAMREKTPRVGRPFTAIFVGRLVPEKGLETLFDAWAQAFQGRTDVCLRLVGGGALEPTLREQAERLGIAGQIDFAGHRDRVEEMFGDADVGVLASRIEGLSNTLLEFMASGLPVVASQVSGSEDFVVNGRNGWLFPVSDVGALAAALREAEAMPPEVLVARGRNARADVESKASLERVVGRLLKLYRGAHPSDLLGSAQAGSERPAMVADEQSSSSPGAKLEAP